MQGNHAAKTGDFGRARTAMKDKYGKWNASKMEEGYTWHHNEDTSTMQLVDRRIHGTGYGGGAHSVALPPSGIRLTRERRMTITLDQAIAKMEASGDWESDENTLWSAKDIADFEAETGMLIPDQLAEVLKRYGWNGFGEPHENALFIAVFEDGTRTTHESQVLVSSKKTIYQSHRMFIANPSWRDQFTLPMIFFGTADGGNSHVLMDGRDRSNNKVYLWEQASDPFGTGNNARGLGLVAPTLFEFFYNLKKSDEI
jgi:hypothetical protein